ncbi:MAG: alpha/beta hydrolase, partial [Spirochaetaceae bacterium]|nr:alpha/beta hydrolase [Spirochaetaceae bacterium]
IHGITDGRVSWSQAAPLMAGKGYRCYVPEYRGNGKTDKPDPGPGGYLVDTQAADIAAFMDILKLEKAHIVGHSLGSFIAQRLNILYPHRTLSLTLIASAVRGAGNALVSWIRDGDGKDYLGIHGYDKEQKMPESFLKGWVENTNEDPDFQAATLEHVRQIPYPVWDYLVTGALAYDNSGDMHKINGSVLVIWGAKDVVFTAQDQEALKQGLVNCRPVYITIPEGSHNVHWDSRKAAEETAAAIDNFIRYPPR